ncbi:hypothetical protein [Pseudomonas chlororaphis]|uniref:hypothetical protein n=1 Tax=Pseudomonas chlororaphis TaxID=587753 RepID=UPI0007B3C493|nr:hypothetical protein [Pseudomonas chlororaphis]AVO59565.1 hypothetical protein C6Q18_16905 [Pseudomonas chlororaphis subsp. piscium]AZC51188.1 lipoprotein [Pseudomonas chlororaphis subsp. piscium]AZC57762.1 lipoprotein [Pseudomonas chlororaphis subsp. piscium]AZC63992.1 lipoprotein [Pseudomonas chlororaphis subsp. piscium]AZC70215.1 lipoprotein [Pseudomonas chlororaphis subsp. piscium]
MKRTLQNLMLCGGLVLTQGCVATSNSFTFTADLPADFAYVAAVFYVPAKGQTCTVARADNLAPQFNPEWRTEYKPDAQIEIRRTRNGCELVVDRVELEINAIYGPDWSDFGREYARVSVRSELPEAVKGTFDAAGESEFSGQCQWLFRTIGPNRYITKILDCKKTDASGALLKNRPFAAYTLDQLPGKTVKMKITLADEEQPYYGRSWVKSSDGWKPCIETKETIRCQSPPTFTDFRMPDGRTCSIYPGCTEAKEVNP